MTPIRTTLSFLAWSLTLWSTDVLAVESDVLRQCAKPPSTTTGRIFYVDPARGSMANDGSSRAPWSTLQDVVAKGLIANKAHKQPYQPGGALQPVNAGGIIRPGDVIRLLNGDHGDVALRGVNDKFITIEAEPSQKPVIRRLTTYGASQWIVRGITFRNNTGGFLVEFYNHGWQGPTDNIVFEYNELLSTADASAWTIQDWLKEGMNGISSAATCLTVKNNRLINIRHGMEIKGPNSLIEGNIIDHFADDGIRILVSDIAVVGNRITNNHGLNDGNHNDGIQGWTVKGAVNENVVIANNVIISSTMPSLPLPGELQGIGIFDGKWRNLRVTGNCVITNHWHGINLAGPVDSIVEGNRVAGTDPKREPWIAVTRTKSDIGATPPRNVIVRNNIAPKFTLPDERDQVLAEGNRNQKFANPTVPGHECGSR
jgi:hypothetical protein